MGLLSGRNRKPNRHRASGCEIETLGSIGGRIVAETFAGLLTYDSQSFFNQDPNWKPTIGDGELFGLKEFVNFALGR